MKKIIRCYKQLSFERKTILNSFISLCLSLIIASGKFIIGLFFDYSLCLIALHTFSILLSKFECVSGLKSEKRSFKTRCRLISLFLLISGIFYVGYLLHIINIQSAPPKHSITYVVSVVLISLAELILAIIGIVRTKNKGFFCFDIKIINFCIASVAFFSAQRTIFLFMSPDANINITTAYASMGIGTLIALCALYIFIAPKVSIKGKEHNAFILKDAAKNKLFDVTKKTVEIPICRSKIYGSYIYRATMQSEQIDGNIERGSSLLERMRIWQKILCCIIPRFWIFIWLVGRLIFVFRSIDVPKRLEKKMICNGFEKIG